MWEILKDTTALGWQLFTVSIVLFVWLMRSHLKSLSKTQGRFVGIVALSMLFATSIGFISGGKKTFDWQNAVLVATALLIVLYTWETRRLKEETARQAEATREQAEATKKLVEEGIRPFVDVELLSIRGKTYLQFIPIKKEIPSRVKINVSGGNFKGDGLGEWEITWPAASWQPRLDEAIQEHKKNANKKLSLELEILAAPRFLPDYWIFSDKKKYHFNFEKNKWEHSGWGERILHKSIVEVAQYRKDYQKTLEEVLKEKS
ncbi:MAG: hypothetical protein AAB897_03945 [Patescibacteria group bacterium]